jgi:hypothetical protein
VAAYVGDPAWQRGIDEGYLAERRRVVVSLERRDWLTALAHADHVDGRAPSVTTGALRAVLLAVRKRSEEARVALDAAARRSRRTARLNQVGRAAEFLQGPADPWRQVRMAVWTRQLHRAELRVFEKALEHRGAGRTRCAIAQLIPLEREAPTAVTATLLAECYLELKRPALARLWADHARRRDPDPFYEARARRVLQHPLLAAA